MVMALANRFLRMTSQMARCFAKHFVERPLNPSTSEPHLYSGSPFSIGTPTMLPHSVHEPS